MSRKLRAKLLKKLSETKKREAEQKITSDPATVAKKIKIVLDLRAGKATKATTPDEILKQVLLSSSQQDKISSTSSSRKTVLNSFLQCMTTFCRLSKRSCKSRMSTSTWSSQIQLEVSPCCLRWAISLDNPWNGSLPLLFAHIL